jgi:hypothetical protein
MTSRRCGVTNGTIPSPKCDILFIPDVVLGAGRSDEATGIYRISWRHCRSMAACCARAEIGQSARYRLFGREHTVALESMQ